MDEMIYAEILFNVKDELENVHGNGDLYAEQYDDQYCSLVREGFLEWLGKNYPNILESKNWDWQTDYRGEATINLFKGSGASGADLSLPKVADEILSSVNREAGKWSLDAYCPTCGGSGGGPDPETRCHSCKGGGGVRGRGRPEPDFASWEEYQWRE